MLKLKCLISICLVSFATLCQCASKYQVATITAVKPHQPASDASDAASYDVTVKVDNTLYVVLYTPPLGTNTVKYAAGRELPYDAALAETLAWLRRREL